MCCHLKSTPCFALHSFTNPCQLLRTQFSLCFFSTLIKYGKRWSPQRPNTNGQTALKHGHRWCKLQAANLPDLKCHQTETITPTRGAHWQQIDALGFGAAIVPKATMGTRAVSQSSQHLQPQFKAERFLEQPSASPMSSHMMSFWKEQEKT